MAVVIHAVEIKGIQVSGYLESYDANAFGGRGEANFTTDLAKAHRFPDSAAAWNAWQEQSTVLPLRPDGLPNRPLSAFSVTFDRVE